MSRVFFSPSTGGFYTTEIHGDAMPADVQRITAARHAQLLEAQAAGAEIVASARGPVARMPKETLASAREIAIGAVKREAKRRILAIAPLWKQLNDVAALALAAMEGLTPACDLPRSVQDAYDRRREIDQIRRFSNGLEERAGAMSSAELAAFDPAADSHWSFSDEG